MSRHKNASSRKVKRMNYAGTYRVASQRDLEARAKMERAGFILDDRPGVPKPVPTRDELKEKLEDESGYRGITFYEPKRKYADSKKPNPHQHVSVFYAFIAEQYTSSRAAG